MRGEHYYLVLVGKDGTMYKVYSKPIAIIVSPLSKRKKRRMTQLLDY